MKFSIILAVAAAAIVGALPQGGPDSAAKLPFLTTAQFGGIYCRDTRSRIWFTLSDDNCGTQRFCEAFDNQDKLRADGMGEPKYKSAQDCFDAHEPKFEELQPAVAEKGPQATNKFPFATKVPYNGRFCLKGPAWLSFELREQYCGTQKYCEAHDEPQKFAVFDGEPQFKTAKECFDAHEPKPAGGKIRFPSAF